VFGLGAEGRWFKSSRPDQPLCASPHSHAGFAPSRGRSDAPERTARHRNLCTSVCTNLGRAYARPARPHRSGSSTFASNAIAAGIDVFELARVMGTSIEIIERHYGRLLSGVAAGIASRLAAFEERQSQAASEDIVRP
jgi:hypothetical protein